MALFRLLHLPSSTHQFQSSLLPFPKPLQLNSIHFVPPVSLAVSRKSRRLNLYECQKVLPAQAQPTAQVSDLEELATEAVVEEDEFSKTRVIAQNVPWNSTADDLRPLFEKYGTVIDIELSMYNKNRNRGLAFITMGSHEEALAALTNLESYDYEGRTLKLNWAKVKKTKPATPPPVPKPLPVHNLFVANLPFQARAKDLKEFFNADNGNVVSAEIIFLENPRRSAGYGFVSFNTKEEAEAALSAFQGKEFMGRAIRVARSKRFLRQGTKAAIQADTASAESNSMDQPEKPEES